jgi:hypothetical protein
MGTEMNEEQLRTAKVVAQLVSNVVLNVIDYAKAKTEYEVNAAEKRIRGSIEDAAIEIAKSEK